MTYHAQLAADGSLPLPSELTRELGLAPGDRVSVDRTGSTLFVRREDERQDAIHRLREAMRDYSVDQFLAERRADWGE
ncbi:AbrB/MazE/SpoVT family DNA-binding domain-containing protein [Sphingomonas sp. CV7422]|uniref:AbrB/MazE/SpoVT family DNA-binding domain-containing protein n=1 Tax=Sphingomonas sp. CV7422 TaxID=3018036 RepID=UPI0022FDE3A4|nr:AbrB/MazE/SpoVT family DNA-binding domain-containing protein [Sphingomonas sp. CV7422]